MAARGPAMATEHARLMREFFARKDLPRDIRALRHEALGVANFVAGQACAVQDVPASRPYFLRALWHAAFARLYPGGEPALWCGVLPKTFLPAAVYDAGARCRRWALDEKARAAGWIARGREITRHFRPRSLYRLARGAWHVVRRLPSLVSDPPAAVDRESST